MEDAPAGGDDSYKKLFAAVSPPTRSTPGLCPDTGLPADECNCGMDHANAAPRPMKVPQARTRADATGWYQRLRPGERSAVDAFRRWLVEVDGRTDHTADSYKSYVAQAIIRLRRGEEWKDFSSDVRSGVRKFVDWAATTDGKYHIALPDLPD